MFYDRCMSQEELVDYIEASPKEKQLIFDFVNNLDRIGVVRLLINGKKLDDFTTELRNRGILTSDSSDIDFSSTSLISDLTDEFIYYFANQLTSFEIFKKDEVLPMLEVLICRVSKPIGVYEIYITLFGFAAKMSNIYFQLLHDYYEEHFDDSEILTKMMLSAIPAIVKPVIHCYSWVYTKYKTFERIAFDNILENLPFDQCCQIFFQNLSVTNGGYSREKIKEEAEYLFKYLIIDDIFKEITNSKKRTSKNINNYLASMIEEKSIYVYIQYIRAFFMLFLEDLDRAQKKNMHMEEIPAMPASYHNGFGNLPS